MILKTSTRLYAHVDCNCFFVSCETLRDPSLRGKCVAVGGDIIVAASYEARKYGIHVGTPHWEAQQLLGTRLVCLKPDFGFYRKISNEFMHVLSERSLSVEPFSIDEAFVDVTGLPDLYSEGDVTRFAKDLKEEILRKVGVPVSVGIANTRIKAKIFSDINKPYGEFVWLDHDDEREAFDRLPVRAIPFVGRNTEIRLGKGIRSVSDFMKIGFFELDRLIGKNATTLWLELQGIDVWRMDHGRNDRQKSILRSQSFNHAMTDNKHVLWRRFLENFEKAFAELVDLECETVEVTVLLRSKELAWSRASRIFDQATADKNQILDACRELMEEVFESGIFYRTTGVQFSGLSPANPKQLSVFEADNAKYERMFRLEKALKGVNDRYGRGSVKLAGTMRSDA